VDLHQAYDEVNRRASKIGCETFDCSFERFKELATECGHISPKPAKEAISILQGEMHGYYKNARRIDYGPNIEGPDYAVDGLGEFKHITHAEAKSGVGSAIKIEEGQDPNVFEQGVNTGKRALKQKIFWSNKTIVS